MPLKATCPNCSAKLNVKDSLAGKTLPCPQCKQALTIPSATSTAPTAPQVPPALPVAKGPPAKKAEPVPIDDDLEVIDDFESDLMLLPSKKNGHRNLSGSNLNSRRRTLTTTRRADRGRHRFGCSSESVASGRYSWER